MSTRSPYRKAAIERERIPDGVQPLELDDGALEIEVQPYTPRLAILWTLVTFTVLAVFGFAVGHGDWFWFVVYPVLMCLGTFARLKRRVRIRLRADGLVDGPYGRYRVQRVHVVPGSKWNLPRLYRPILVLVDGEDCDLALGMRRAQAEYVVRTLNARLERTAE